MQSVKRLPVVSKTYLIASLAAVLALAMATPAFAVQTVELEYLCADDVSAIGSCTANEVSLANVTNVTITDLDDNVLTECTAGQQIKIQSLDAELNANTGTRYDVIFWIGRFGNDPRIGTGAVDACAAISLPDDTGSAFIGDFELGANTDNCEDLAQPPAPLPINFGGGGAELTCADSNGDFIADLQIVTTWHQNENFDCGEGDPSLSPGAPSKCDYTILNLVPFIVNPAMSIEKTVTDVGGDGAGGNVDEVGDVITYQVLVTNTGDVPLTNVDIGDPLLLDFSCDVTLPAATLAVAGVITCTGTYTATQADIDGGGPVLNESFATSDDTGLLNDDASVPVVQTPDVDVVKTATDVDGDTENVLVDEAGDQVNYEIVVTNVGNVSITGGILADPLLGGNIQGPTESGTVNGILEVGETWTYTGFYVATQNVLNTDGGGDSDIDNTANFTCAETACPVADSAEVPIVQLPDYTVVKTVTDVDGGGSGGSVDVAGDVITYQVVVTNTGNITLTGVDLSDPLFAGFDSSTDCSPAAPATLAVGAAMTCTGSYTAVQADLDANGNPTPDSGTITNTATASSNEVGDESDSASVPLAGSASMSITKTVTDVNGAGPAGVIGGAGQVITYQIVVANTGSLPLSQVTVTDPLLDAPPTCNPVAPAALAVGESMTCTGSYTSVQQDLDDDGNPTPDSGFIVNVATANATDGETPLPPVDDTTSVPVAAVPGMEIVKTVTAPAGAVSTAGEQITYQITVENTGNVTLNNVGLDDSITTPVCNPVVPAVLAPGAIMTCTATYTVLQADLDNEGGGDGDIDNIATASADEVPDETDSADVALAFSPGLTLEKTSATAEITTSGIVIEYSFVLTNVGNVSLSAVSLGDPNLDATAVCNPAIGSGLAPGAAMNCTGEHTVTLSELINLASLVNTATADSNETGPVIDTVAIPIAYTPPPGAPSVPVPVDGKWALALLVLMLLGAGLYLRPGIARRQS